MRPNPFVFFSLQTTSLPDLALTAPAAHARAAPDRAVQKLSSLPRQRRSKPCCLRTSSTDHYVLPTAPALLTCRVLPARASCEDRLDRLAATGVIRRPKRRIPTKQTLSRAT